ncbi:hypothetical protein ACWGLF_43710 [Streptomyces puniciscabiei]
MHRTALTCPDAEAAVPARPSGAAHAALAAAVLGFLGITFDAVVVNVALPSIRRDVGGGITGLQWVEAGDDGAGLAAAVVPPGRAGGCGVHGMAGRAGRRPGGGLAGTGRDGCRGRGLRGEGSRSP